MASLFVFLVLACAALASSAAGLRVELTRIHTDPHVTASQLMREALRRDMSRHARFGRELASSEGTIVAPTRKDLPHGAQYVMTLAIGTPPMEYPAIADTGSNLIMTQCAPCSSKCFKQLVPLYDPSSSPTFAELPCNSSLRPGVCAATDGDAANAPPGCPCTLNQTYAEGWAFATLGVETFTFGSTAGGQVAVAGIAFSCINESSGGWGGSAGIVGLGRGKLSLVSQLGAGKFSYCLTPFQDTNSTSTLLLGPSSAINDDTGVRSTPLVASPSEAYYYLNLTGISVGSKALFIPPDAFSLRTDGSGGIIIDSGWTTTSLVDVAYQQVRAEVLSLVTLPLVDASSRTKLELCFQLPSKESTPPAMPDMTFHFDGADMVLPVDNYMYLDSEVWCLCLHNATESEGSVLGNYQQQNMHLLFDIQNEMLSFAPAECSTL